MPTRMLIDARHPEETRVAVLKGNRIEEFDFESTEHQQIKGNIYLAKVTRVEPSLQAAFVDFGGNRHGFLAFSEIHPDYYQIPAADRQALLAEEAEAAEEEARLRDAEEEAGISPGDEYDAAEESGESLVEDFAENGVEEVGDGTEPPETIEGGIVDDERPDDDTGDEIGDDNEAEDGDRDAEEEGSGRERNGRGRQRRVRGRRNGKALPKAVDEVRERRLALRRRYRIQDVIQRRQVLLVQVVKEERGNKGAALTTYLSLAGRYTVLMPNSSHGGGISRKISSAGDRKRLKQIVGDLQLPRSMGLIVRTAGLERTKPEIKRDFDYLARLWDEIRERTLASTAPALIHSDSDLIKRAIRDIYNRDIEEVIVEGEEGYRSAKSFMKLLMPSHARKVKAYVDPVPLFQRFGAEDQLRAMYDPTVQLKSGGYLVINPTEALVSIDINSGRSTKEYGIEQTALNTNLEAAAEIARQLRLRDMAGLVVIDFIDMEHGSNVRKVEKAMKEALRNDRARIQLGRISSFGLMEMSRQRLRTGVLEATTRECPHCDGTGLVRTASSAGLSGLRLIEDEAARGKGSLITLSASTEAAIYLLNAKRADLQEIERRYGVTVEVVPEGENEGAKMSVASSGPRPTRVAPLPPVPSLEDDDEDLDYPEDEDEIGSAEGDGDERGDYDRGEGGDRRRRRRRRGRREERGAADQQRDDSDTQNGADSNDQPVGEDDETEQAEGEAPSNGERGEGGRRKRRRGGRGRRNRERGRGEDREDEAHDDLEQADAPVDLTAGAEALAQLMPAELDSSIAVVADVEGAPQTAEAMAAASASADGEEAQQDGAEQEPDLPPVEKPKRVRTRRRKAEDAAPATDDAAAAQEAPAADTVQVDAAAAEEKPRRRRSRAKAKDVPEAAAAVDAAGGPEDVQIETAAREGSGGVAELADGRSDDTAATTLEPAESAVEAAPGDTGADAAEGDVAEPAPAAEAKPRRGWWQRTFGE